MVSMIETTTGLIGEEFLFGNCLGYYSDAGFVPLDPQNENKIQSYFPQDLSDLLANCKIASIHSTNMPKDYPIDPITYIFSFLNPLDLSHVSQVCKKFYFASQNPSLFESLLHRTLPYVQLLNPCSFSEIAQIKIIFHRIIAETKPYFKWIKQVDAVLKHERIVSFSKSRADDPQTTHITDFQKSDDSVLMKVAFQQIDRNQEKFLKEDLLSESQMIFANYNNQKKFEEVIRSREKGCT